MPLTFADHAGVDLGVVRRYPQPNQLATALFAWWKDDTLSGADGDPISTRSDSSGNGRDLTQSGTARPLLKLDSNGINGRPAALFDTSNDLMVTAAMTLNQPFSVFAIIRTGSDVTSDHTILSGAVSEWDCYVSGGNFKIYAGVVGGAVVAATSTTYAVVFEVNGTSSNIWINGIQGSNFNAGTANSTSVLRMGSNPASAALWNNLVGEAGIYNAILSAADKTRLGRYLRMRAGT